MKSKTKSDSGRTQLNKEMCANISHSVFMNSQQTAIGMECVWMCGVRAAYDTQMLFYTMLGARHRYSLTTSRPAHMFRLQVNLFQFSSLAFTDNVCFIATKETYSSTKRTEMMHTHALRTHTHTKSE